MKIASNPFHGASVQMKDIMNVKLNCGGNLPFVYCLFLELIFEKLYVIAEYIKVHRLNSKHWSNGIFNGPIISLCKICMNINFDFINWPILAPQLSKEAFLKIQYHTSKGAPYTSALAPGPEWDHIVHKCKEEEVHDQTLVGKNSCSLFQPRFETSSLILVRNLIFFVSLKYQ